MRYVVLLFACLVAPRCQAGSYIDLRVKGEMAKVYTAVTPTLVVNSLTELRAHYAEVRDLLPPTPFIMDGQWVVRLEADGPKTFSHQADAEEYFSPSGAYVLRVRRSKLATGEIERQKEQLLTLAAQPQWERECACGLPFVLDNGDLLEVRIEGDMGPVTVEAVDGQTGVTTKQAHVGFASLSAVPCWQAGLLLIRDTKFLTAIDAHGGTLWRLAFSGLPRDMGQLGEPLGWDPLGRGICVSAVDPPAILSVVALDAATGKPAGVVVKDRTVSSLRGLSPRGTMLAFTARGGVGLLDWRTGRVLFAQSPEAQTQAGDSRVRYIDAVTASDAPARVAAPVLGDTVYDQDGRMVWRNYLHADSARRLVLSADGMRLGTVLWELVQGGQGPVVSSVVIYSLPADGEVMRGL